MCVVVLDPFSPVYIRIYKPSLTAESAVLVKVAERQFDRTEWVVSFKIGTSKKTFC